MAANILETLYSECDGYIELRALGKRKSSAFFRRDDPQGMKAWIAEHRDCDLYFAVATRDGKAGRRENVVCIPAVWVDIDYKTVPGGEKAAIKILDEFPLQPTIRVFSGGGCHAYWKLKEPCTLEEADHLEGIMRGLASRLNGDMACAEVARILRIPNTRNHKYKPPRPVVLAHCNGTEFSLSDFDDFVDCRSKRTKSSDGLDVDSILGGVTEGSRDISIFKYACRLREKNISYPEAKSLILMISSKCSPPFPETEALKKLERAWKYEPGGECAFESLESPESPKSQSVTEVAMSHQKSPESLKSEPVTGITTGHQESPGEPVSPELSETAQGIIQGAIRDCHRAPSLPKPTQTAAQDSPPECEWPPEELWSLESPDSPESLGERAVTRVTTGRQESLKNHQGPHEPYGQKSPFAEPQPSVNQTKIIKDWVDLADGIFTIQDVARELPIKSTKSYNILKKVLKNLVRDKTLERHGNTRGVYRKVDKDLEEMKWWEAGEETEYDIELPLEISELCKILPKNIIVIAGEKNSAKTALALNIAKLNMYRTQVHYFTSEMGSAELRHRLAAFEDTPVTEWRKVKFYDRCTNFQDFIKPDALNIVDFIEIHEEFYRMGGILRGIYDNLENGVAVVCLQKKPGVDTGKGGEVTLEKARLAIALSTLTDAAGRIYNQAKLVKVKVPRDHYSHPQNMVIDFNIIGGWKILQRGEWHFEQKQQAKRGMH